MGPNWAVSRPRNAGLEKRAQTLVGPLEGHRELRRIFVGSGVKPERLISWS